MTKTRTIGTLAAMGAVTATIALLTGLPAANADELADLRANQELLKRRIDQLAQGEIPPSRVSPGIAPALGAEAIPGQAIIGGSFPRSFLIPGTDTSIRVGGFVDLTANYFFQGANTGNPGTPSSNFGQNGNLNGVPVGQQFVPGLGNVPQQASHSRGNGFFEFSPQQSRLNVETRTPTAWGESRTFLEFDWSGSNNFSAQTVQQAGGDSLLPRLRFAYGTLGGFLAGQAISNFADADADTESMEFGGAMGSTGGLRIPQVRYTIATPFGGALSVSAEQPTVAVLTPAGLLANDSNVGGLPGGPGAPTPIGPICNGVPCTGAGTAVQGNLAKAIAPNVTIANYWAQPWGHVDFAGVLVPTDFNDGHFIDRTFLGYGGHFSGDVKPGWFGWAKDDFLFSFIAGEGLGPYLSGGWSGAVANSTNFTVATACATPQPGCVGGMAASNIIFKPVFGYSTNGGYQHWWAPNLRSTIAAGTAQQDISSQLVGPSQSSTVSKQQWNAFVNLVWNPVAFITAGIQYNYGTRIVVANGKGHAQGVSAKFRVAF
jgi:hypothetical protein